MPELMNLENALSVAAMTDSPQEAIRQLQSQRDFLLTHTWVNADPDVMRGGMAGCLIARNTGNNAMDRLLSPMARRSLLLSLALLGYDLESFPTTQQRCRLMLPGSTYFDDDDRWHANAWVITQVNDVQFYSAGEAIATLEQSILNIKEAFGES